MRYSRIGSVIVFGLFVWFSPAQTIDESIYAELLKTYVSTEGEVDYKGLLMERTHLDTYLEQYKEIYPESDWSDAQVLAYWINAYNAFTLKLILDHYPVRSIRAIGKPWKQPIVLAGPEQMSLDAVEHDILRKRDEPRIHFAINCASRSCPKLANEPYRADRLEEQLERVTRDFIQSDANTLTADSVSLSAIFKWFREDFEATGVLPFINRYSGVMLNPDAKIRYKPYDWSLNE